MSLKNTVDNAIKDAMRAKDKVQLDSLRAIKAAILLAETAEGRAPGTPLAEEDEMKILQKLAKQRRDSIEQFSAAGRTELAENESAQLAVIEQFLPKPLTAEELEAALRDLIARLGVTSAKEMGKVMGAASKELSGKADGKAISETVKRLLA